jgi:hypothetical protein
MAVIALKVEQKFVTCECYQCGVLFAMTEEHQRYFLDQRAKANFYCPNGHSQCYTGLSDKEKLDQEKARHQETLARLNVAEAERERLKQRIKRGVCPCCKRSFKALARHIETKHPDYAGKK